MMKTKHDGDCSIYATLDNGRVEDGICICGYGLERLRNGDSSEMYSEDLIKKLEERRNAPSKKKLE